MKMRNAAGKNWAGAIAVVLLGPVSASGQSPELDLAPLQKAFARLSNSASMASESELTMVGSGQGIQFTFRERIKLTQKQPGRFRSELTLIKPDGTPGAKYLVVSDGASVWTFRPGTRQYAVTTRAEFDKSDDALFVQGVFGSLPSNPMTKGLSEMPKGSDAQVLEVFGQMGMTLSGGTESVGGIDTSAYTLLLKKEGITMRFLLDPTAPSMKRVEMKIKQPTMDISINEAVKSSTAPASITAGLFQFTPPPGAVKVPKLSIQPF